MWSIDEFVRPEDQPYEVELLKNHNNPDSWLKYYRAKRSASFKNRVFVLERAVRQFPDSDEFWSLYLETCQKELARPKPEATTTQVNRVFQRLLLHFQNDVSWWLRYLVYLLHTQPFEISLIRRSFNECLFRIPIEDHAKIWPTYLEFAQSAGGVTGANIYRKLLCYATPEELAHGDDSTVLPSLESVVFKLAEYGDIETSLEILTQILNQSQLSSALTTSPFHFFLQYLDLLLQFSAVPETDKLIEGLARATIPKYPDEAGKINCKVAQYFVKRKDNDKARSYFDQGLRQCATAEDFALIYDSYTSFEEDFLLDLAEDDPEVDDHLQKYEKLLDQRSLLLNDMFLRQDENNIDNWFSRVSIFKEKNDTNSVLTTYATALTQINPLKAYSLLKRSENSLPRLWSDYAQVYSSHKDYNTADFIFAKAVKTKFKSPDDLAAIYIEWSKLWLEKDFEKSVAILQAALERAIEHPDTVDYHDSSIPLSERLVKSIKLWSYYLDLLESSIDYENPEGSKNAINDVEIGYNRVIELKIATPLTIVNFASFYEDLKFYERSYTVYEKGLQVFKDSRVRFEIWNVYLSKLYKRQVSKERTRELFEKAIYGFAIAKDDGCPADLCKPLVLLYSQFEHENGLDLKSVKVLKDGILKISKALDTKELTDRKVLASDLLEDKVALYNIVLARVEIIGDKSLARETYEKCLQDKHLKLSHIVTFTLRFIKYESSLGETTRTRALFRYVCNLGHPELPTLVKAWDEWEQFELKNGNETTFKDMLQFRRTVKESSEAEEQLKAGINPMGFVKENKKRPREEETNNPDTIDIDMDM